MNFSEIEWPRMNAVVGAIFFFLCAFTWFDYLSIFLLFSPFEFLIGSIIILHKFISPTNPAKFDILRIAPISYFALIFAGLSLLSALNSILNLFYILNHFLFSRLCYSWHRQMWFNAFYKNEFIQFDWFFSFFSCLSF